MFAYCILFVTFCSMGTLVRRKKTWRYSARKVMEFGQLMADIPVYVFCMFKKYIFEIAQVIGENVPIAFLYVLSICVSTLSNMNISETSGLIVTKFYLNHHWVGGKDA